MYRIWILINMNDDFDYVLYVCDEVNPLFAEKLKPPILLKLNEIV